MLTQKMKVEEIRQILITQYNIPEEEVNNIKGKTNLVNKLLSLTGEDMTMASEESFTITGFEQPSEEVSTLTRTHKNWSKYILEQLADDEKDGIYPKADGLRRLLEKEICPITSFHTDVIQPPQMGNNMTATVRAQIILNNGETYTAVADAAKADLEYPYSLHVTAIAETRAEGRVFRKALRLKNIVTKEEMVDKKQEQDDKINKTQLAIIENLCMNDRLNINVHKLLKNLFGDNTSLNIFDYSHTSGAEISKKLTEFQSKPENIPTEIMGYDPSWK